MRIEASAAIERPVPVVWEFYAVNHVENHPRWDPSIELEATSDAPMGVGTVIHRRVTRFEKVTEGTMEVIEFDAETAMRVRTQDGPMAIAGWALFEAVAEGETKLTLGGEIPGIDDSVAEQTRSMMERSATNIKTLIESET